MCRRSQDVIITTTNNLVICQAMQDNANRTNHSGKLVCVFVWVNKPEILAGRAIEHQSANDRGCKLIHCKSRCTAQASSEVLTLESVHSTSFKRGTHTSVRAQHKLRARYSHLSQSTTQASSEVLTLESEHNTSFERGTHT